MLMIALCDDEDRELSCISSLIEDYKNKKAAALKCDAFSTAFDLLDAMRRQAYDILLLDVMMPGMNGLTAAREIRSFDPAVKIIFLTSSPEFAVDSYAVNAHYYLLKPCTPDKLFPILDRIQMERDRSGETLTLVQSSGLHRILVRRIEYVEVLGKKLMFHFDDGSTQETRGSITDFEDKLLCMDSFLKVHRSFIVNMNCIRTLTARDIQTYVGQSVPVSRLLHHQVKEAYMRFLFTETRV